MIRIATERIPAQYDLDPVREVQILAPQYKGPLGIDSLHARIRETLCGSAERVAGGQFSIGEKVLITRSIPELEIANGTMFVIDSADEDDPSSIWKPSSGSFSRSRSRMHGRFAVASAPPSTRRRASRSRR